MVNSKACLSACLAGGSLVSFSGVFLEEGGEGRPELDWASDVVGFALAPALGTTLCDDRLPSSQSMFSSDLGWLGFTRQPYSFQPQLVLISPCHLAAANFLWHRSHFDKLPSVVIIHEMYVEFTPPASLKSPSTRECGIIRKTYSHIRGLLPVDMSNSRQ